MFDSTIDFGDDLPADHFERGWALANAATLCVVLGSRCSVSPACEMPLSVAEADQRNPRSQNAAGRKLVVVNLQRTAADDYASLRIGAKIDEVMVPLMEELGISIPSWTLHRRLTFTRDQRTLLVGGRDAGLPADILWNVQAAFALKEQKKEQKKRHVAGDTSEALASVAIVEESAPEPGPVRVRLNQDSAGLNANLEPGDTAIVNPDNSTGWPWSDPTKPGFAEAVLSTGHSAGSEFGASVQLLDVVDELVPLPRTRGRRGKLQQGNTHGQRRTIAVANAGSVTGPDLFHSVELPPAEKPIDLLGVQLMFRGHFCEPPVWLPAGDLPQHDGESLELDLFYRPEIGRWERTKSSAP
eukprot:SAG31_NODE_5628_length_2415_cov_1.735320_2_plen_356_part_00